MLAEVGLENVPLIQVAECVLKLSILHLFNLRQPDALLSFLLQRHAQHLQEFVNSVYWNVAISVDESLERDLLLYYQQLGERSDNIIEGYLSFAFILLWMLVFNYLLEVLEFDDLV